MADSKWMSLATEVPNREGMALRPPFMMKMDLPAPPHPDSKALRFTLTAPVPVPQMDVSASFIAHRQRMAVV